MTSIDPFPGSGLSDYHRRLAADEVSTGTTIMAVSCGRHGVVLGADSRVSTGTYIANRVSDKIVQVSSHIFVCRSGSAADTQALTDYLKYYLQSLSIETGGRPLRVKTAAHLLSKLMYNNKDNLNAGVLLAGWDAVDGGSVYSIPMGGSCLREPFALGGSGSGYIYGLVDAAMQQAVTEAPEGTTAADGVLSLDQARTLVKQAVSHAMARDGSSGGIIRTVVVADPATYPAGSNVTFERDYTPGNQLPFGPKGF